MPELPEVESLAQMLRPELEGCTLTAVRFFRQDLRFAIPTEKFTREFVGHKIKKVFRRSKYMLWQTEHAVGLFHLGMSGKMLLMNTPEPELKHTHAVFSVTGPKTKKPNYIHFVDPRRFGIIDCFDAGEMPRQKFLKHLGPEPLDEKKLGEHLFSKSRRKAQPIKNFIMDARVVVGVGNIYASEALFRAGVLPNKRAGKVDLAAYKLLAKEIKATLRKAIAAGGTTFRDYRKADGSEGENLINLNVYDRLGAACLRCKDAKIKRIKLGGRSTYFCPKCQR